MTKSVCHRSLREHLGSGTYTEFRGEVILAWERDAFCVENQPEKNPAWTQRSSWGKHWVTTSTYTKFILSHSTPDPFGWTFFFCFCEQWCLDRVQYSLTQTAAAAVHTAAGREHKWLRFLSFRGHDQAHVWEDPPPRPNRPSWFTKHIKESARVLEEINNEKKAQKVEV